MSILSSTSTSYLNTPQAKDDFYTLSENTLQTQYFNVTSNDLGGAAKTLWAITEGTENTLTSNQVCDLLSKDAPDLMQTSLKGARVWITEDGRIGYDASGAPFAETLNSLPQGESFTDTITYAIRLSNGTLSFATMTVTFTGENDAPVARASTAEVLEDGSVVGKVDASDVDSGAILTYALKPGQTVPEGLNFNIDGTYSFSAESYDSLRAGQKQNFVVTYVVTDQFGESSEATLTITITGVNDNATIGGDNDGTVTEDGTQTTGGTIDVSDADTGEDKFTAVSDAVLDTDYGDFTFDPESGEWGFTLNNDAAQALAQGQQETVTLEVASFDGTATQTIEVTINGTNDNATISGDDDGAVTEDAGTTLSTSGTLAVSDVDTGEAEFVPQTNVAGTYGTFSIDKDGNWSYSANNSQTAIQSLGATGSLIEIFSVASKDGTGTENVTITINGTNDNATISGDNDGAVTEDAGTTLSTSGTLAVSDVDTGEAEFVPQTNVAGTYGTFSIDKDGNWSYSANNSQTAIQSLGATGSLTEIFSVASKDGTGTENVTITINGTNDNATISGDNDGAVTEDAGTTLSTSGTLAVSDVDTGEAEFVLQTNVAGTYGTFSIDKDGNWSYSANNSQTAIQSLGATGSLIEIFSVASKDGTGTENVTITINGTNDNATISGTKSGSVTEDGTLTTGGTLAITDADAGQSTFVATTSPVTGASGYGAFTLTAAGVWTYTLNNALAAVQALNSGQSLTDSFTVTSFDGTKTEQITVTINGANEPVTTDSNDFDNLTDKPTSNNNANDGNNTLVGTDNGDTFNGIAGDDVIYGRGGNDVLSGGDDEDVLYGQPGNDTLNGGLDNDTIYGGSGNDSIDGGAGLDSLFGGSGDDIITGGSEADTIIGGVGHDSLSGSTGNDSLVGGDGNDTLIGGGGNDTLTGNEDADVFVFQATDSGQDIIIDFTNTPRDIIDLSAIDANIGTAAKENFIFAGTTATAYSVWYTVTGQNQVTVSMDTNGNTATSEMNIIVNGVNALTADAFDFIL